MPGRRIELFSLLGLPVRVDPSWILLAALLVWTLARGVFPAFHPELAASTHLVMGLAGTLGLVLSLLAHELAHALVAREYGLRIGGITLFLFGGVSELQADPPSPEAELMVAIAGPIASAGTALGLFALSVLGAWSAWPPGVAGVVGFLALANAALAAFNLIPAFPLDGGRILRSVLWRWHRSLARATRSTSRLGTFFGFLLLAAGAVFLVSGAFLMGLWWVLLGLFLRSAARASYQRLLVRRALSGQPVRRFMATEPLAVPRAIPVSQAVEQYFSRRAQRSFPVVDGDRLLGWVSPRKVLRLPREEWDRTTVGALVRPLGKTDTVEMESDAGEALRRMAESGREELLVVRGEALVGVLSVGDLLRPLKLDAEPESAR